MTTDPTTGGTVRYHDANYMPDRPGRQWQVQFTPGGDWSWFTAEQGEAMGLTPPAPAPLVVTCNGHSVELIDEDVAPFVDVVLRMPMVQSGYGRAASVLARLLRDARQDPQPATDTPDDEMEPCGWCYGTGSTSPLNGKGTIGWSPCTACNGSGKAPQPAPADSDTLDFEAMPVGTIVKHAGSAWHRVKFDGRWHALFSPSSKLTEDEWDVVHMPAPVSPAEGLRAVLAGRDDADELIEYASRNWRGDNHVNPGKNNLLVGAVGDAARSGGA